MNKASLVAGFFLCRRKIKAAFQSHLLIEFHEAFLFLNDK